MAIDLAPDVAALLAQIASGPEIRFRDLTAEEARSAVREMALALDLPPDPAVQANDHVIRGEGGGEVKVRSYAPPEGEDDSPLIVFVHGGGWIMGDLDSYDSFCRFLAASSGLSVVSVDYRRAPEWVFPAAYENALLVARALLSGATPIPCKDGIIVAGDSAGGGIAAALARTLSSENQDIRAHLLFYPVVDVARRSASYSENAVGYLLEAADMEHFIDAYVPDPGARRDLRCSPLLSERMTGLPPLVIVTCGYDVLRDEGQAYAESCTRDGVETSHIQAPRHTHGFVTMRAAISSGNAFLDRAIEEIKRLSTAPSIVGLKSPVGKGDI